jgi:PAS domain S-box-containing protein
MANKIVRPLHELAIGLLALGVGVFTIALVVWLNLALLERAVVRDREASDVLAQADAVMESLINQETGLRGYVISADPAFLEPYDAGRRQLQVALQRLSTLTADAPAQHRRVAEVARLAADWTETLARPEIAAVRQGDMVRARGIVVEGVGKRRMDAIRATLGDLRRTELAVMKARGIAQARAFTTARWMLLAGSLGGLALALAIGGRTVLILIRSRREAEEATAFLNTVVEAMPAMLVVKGADHRFTMLNRAGEDLLGVSRHDLVGKTDHDLFPADQADFFVAADREALATAGGLDIPEEPIATPSGLRYLTTRKIGIRAADGADYLVIISTDITHLKSASAALTEALDQAHAADRAKTQFLANMSHELRTPLNGVSGVAAVLAGTSLDATQQGLVDTIRASAAALDGLVGDLLALSRAAAGGMGIEIAPFHLGDTVREAAAEYTAKAAAKGLRLQTTVAADGEVRVQGDAARLRQILASLLSNAVKFTDQGDVSVSVEATTPHHYRIEVRDTGVGFDVARKQELFREFAQSDDSATRRHGGAGLGLAVARQAALLVGAQLDCHSAAGIGSTFWFEINLPAEATDAPMAAAAADLSVPDAGDRDAEAALRVLIVDDHPINRQVLELILGQRGVDCVSVEDGRQAVEAVAAQAFDTILMDIQMPVMDGITATREIRRLELASGRPAAPVIIVSANCQPEHIKAGQDAGAQRHLAKPIDAQALIEALNDVLADQQKAA